MVTPAHGPNSSTMGVSTNAVESPDSRAAPAAPTTCDGPFELELLGNDGLRYEDWTMVRPERVSFTGKDAGYRYLRAKGNSIEGGTSEILRNIVAERVLGLPAEARTDKDVPWTELER